MGPLRAAEWRCTARASEIAHRLVGYNSEGGTAGEASFAGRLRDLLLEIPYFRERPDDIILLDSHGDPMTQNVVAIVRGRGTRTLALAGHFDTVSVGNYHDLAPLACQPEALTEALLADLGSRPLSDQEERAFADLNSGDFVPGRGMLDMKSGLAAGIAVLERFAARSDRIGNLVLFASPDEERESRGMRALRESLPALMQAQGLVIEAAINMDVTSDQGDGSIGRAVYEGTIGKLLPFAFIVGQSSHASYPFEGISAQLIGAEILRGIECNADLADKGNGDVSPPPICLEARDTRSEYEVTTPERFWLSFNWLYHSGSAADRFLQFRAEVEAALSRAGDRLRANAAAFTALTGARPGATMASPTILTLAELRDRVVGDTAAREAFAAYEAGLASLDNPLILSRLLTSWLVDAARIKGPAVVIGFAGLHYPPSRLDPVDPRGAALLRAIEEGQRQLGEEPQAQLIRRPYFQGISDMSFLGQRMQAGAAVVAENTPAARLVDKPGAAALEFPAVNIGPWGREFHQRLERVHAPYAFGVLPRLLAAIAEDFLSGTADA
ncbi:M20/M25/M40 family metallo-hydrolase [Mangrovicella endophytica]|uniref:M20/M25/M40 family metallo-hydrolase n=1 Tax=Mangrovicella endophytica TaxID=2066697 RepID=UPI000C9E63F8